MTSQEHNRQKSAERHLRLTWIIGGLLLLGIVVATIITTYRFEKSIDRLNNELLQAKEQLSSAIRNEATLQEQRTINLGNALNSTINELSQTVIEEQQLTRTQIASIERELNELDKRNQNLETQLVDLRITSQDFSVIAQESLTSVVSIYTNLGSGSGAIIDSEGYVVTNHHVIDDITAGVAQTTNQKRYRFRIVASNPTLDLALIKLDTTTTMQSLDFERSSNVKVGERVIALGSPAGLEFTVTEGIVSSTSRTNPDGVAFVQVDVPINPGNSGGPIINLRGNIIGITTWKVKGFEGLGFAVQSDLVDSFVTDAIEEDKARLASQG